MCETNGTKVNNGGKKKSWTKEKDPRHLKIMERKIGE